MHYALTKFDSMALGDVDEGDGRGAIDSILETAGTPDQQLRVFEKELMELQVDSKAGYIPFSKKLGRIKGEWRTLAAKTPTMNQSDHLSPGRLKRIFLEKIKVVFPGIWRDAKRAGSTETLASMHRLCMELARDAKSQTTPVSHANIQAQVQPDADVLAQLLV